MHSPEMSKPTFARTLKFCNAFWYFMMIFSVLLLAIVIVRLELYARNRVAMGIYFGVPVLLFVVAVAMLKFVGPIQRLNLSLLAASVVSSVFLMEIYLAFYGQVDTRALKAFASGVPIDQRSRKEVIEALRHEGRQAYLTIHPLPLLEQSERKKWHSILSIDNQEILPLGGIASVDTVYNRESGQWVVYQSDEYGFRNPSGIWSHEDFDLVVIGDSFTHGAGLLDGEDVVSLLRKQLPNTVNLGNGGNGPLTAFASLREYGPALRPHFVVYCYYEGNDLGDLEKEKDSPLLMRYLEDPSWSQHLYARHMDVNSTLLEFGENQIRKFYVQDPLVSLRQMLTLSHLRGRIGLDLATAKREPRRLLKGNLDLFEVILQRMNEEVQSWGGTFLVGYLPAWDRYRTPHPHNIDRNNVLNILKKHKIPLIDLHPIFEKQSDVFSLFHFGLDGHYNKIGAQLVAEEIGKRLESVSQKVTK